MWVCVCVFQAVLVRVCLGWTDLYVDQLTHLWCERSEAMSETCNDICPYFNEEAKNLRIFSSFSSFV